MFDRLLKNYIRVTIAVCVLSLILGATAFTTTMFYLSSYRTKALFSAEVRQVKVTAYRSIKSQTDSTPYHTSIGHRTHPFGVAVSRDLIKEGIVKYGDVLYVPGYGFRVVNDLMGPKSRRAIDLWVATYEEEKEVGIRKLSVIVLKSNG